MAGRKRFSKAARAVQAGNTFKAIANPRWKVEITDHKLVDHEDCPLIASFFCSGRHPKSKQNPKQDKKTRAALLEIVTRHAKDLIHAKDAKDSHNFAGDMVGSAPRVDVLMKASRSRLKLLGRTLERYKLRSLRTAPVDYEARQGTVRHLVAAASNGRGGATSFFVERSIRFDGAGTLILGPSAEALAEAEERRKKQEAREHWFSAKLFSAHHAGSGAGSSSNASQTKRRHKIARRFR